MSIISITKGQTAHRGYVYYTDKKVLQMESAGVNKWRGKVAGSNGGNTMSMWMKSILINANANAHMWKESRI